MTKRDNVLPFRGPGITPLEIGGFTFEQIAELLAGVEAAQSVLTNQQADHIQAEIEADRESEIRRVCLNVLTQTGAHLITGVAEDDELAAACAAVLARLSDYRKRLNELQKLMDESSVRMCVALSLRKDGQALLDAEITTLKATEN